MLDRIHEAAGRLSRAERQVADWVLDHPREAAESTVAAVAAASGASEPSVIRFCRRIGLSGFRELTIRLTEALSRPDSYLHTDVNADDATPDAVTKVVDAAIRALVELRSQLSTMPIDEAVAVMAGARQLVFAGLGASGYVAADARHKFFRLGIPCSVLTDTPSIRQFAAIAGSGDVIIAISKAGNRSDLGQAFAKARDNGAAILAVTERSSALAASADFVLGCESREDTNIYTPMNSRLVHLALFDALHVSLALAIGDEAAENLRRSKEALGPVSMNPQSVRSIG